MQRERRATLMECRDWLSHSDSSMELRVIQTLCGCDVRGRQMQKRFHAEIEQPLVICVAILWVSGRKLYRRVERWIIDKSREINISTEFKWYIFEPIVNTNTFTRFPNTDLGSHYVIHLFKILNGIAMPRYTTPESYPLPIAIHVWQPATNRAATRYDETPNNKMAPSIVVVGGDGAVAGRFKTKQNSGLINS